MPAWKASRLSPSATHILTIEQAKISNSAGLCPSGTWGPTLNGSCCPNGTENVHAGCATPASEDAHNAKIANFLQLLFGIVPGPEGTPLLLNASSSFGFIANALS
jgi:hypothetical protein